MAGSLFERCGCTALITRPDGSVLRKKLGNTCPRIRRASGGWSASHGTWWFSAEAPSTINRGRAPIRHGGYRRRSDAAVEQSRVLGLLALAAQAEEPKAARADIADVIRAAYRSGKPLPDPAQARPAISSTAQREMTVGQWLRTWLNARQDLRPATALSYRSLTERYLLPLLGDVPLVELRADHIQAALNTVREQAASIEAANSVRRAVAAGAKHAGDRDARDRASEQLRQLPAFTRPPHAATVQRIRAVLRSALTSAAEQDLIATNPAKQLRLPAGHAPRALVWTPPRVEAWQRTGIRPSPVMVWTAPQTRAFLQCATGHHLYPLFLLIAHLGLRRGEACGLCWSDVDLDAGTVQVRRQLVEVDGHCRFGEPKTEAGYRTLGLAQPLVAALREHRRGECAEHQPPTAARPLLPCPAKSRCSRLHPAPCSSLVRYPWHSNG